MRINFKRHCLPWAATTLALAFLAISSCSLAGIFSDDTGTIALSIDVPRALTIVPTFDMTPVSYLVTGTGPKNGTFRLTTTSTTVSKSGLKAGTWKIKVSARNAATTAIADGTGSVQVTGNQSTTLSVPVMPLTGAGSLSITVTWNSANAPGAAFTGQLLPSTGAAIPLSFAMGTGTATAAASSVPAGYYTLTLQMLNYGVTLTGAVDVARIIQGQTTSGSYDFSGAAATGGMLSVSITSVDTSPLTITLSGQTATLASGSSMTVTAGDSGYSGNVTYLWYLNGAYFASGTQTSASEKLGSTLAVGAYRLDVAALSADGLRAGATTTTFTVQ